MVDKVRVVRLGHSGEVSVKRARPYIEGSRAACVEAPFFTTEWQDSFERMYNGTSPRTIDDFIPPGSKPQEELFLRKIDEALRAGGVIVSQTERLGRREGVKLDGYIKSANGNDLNLWALREPQTRKAQKKATNRAKFLSMQADLRDENTERNATAAYQKANSLAPGPGYYTFIYGAQHHVGPRLARALNMTVEDIVIKKSPYEHLSVENELHARVASGDYNSTETKYLARRLALQSAVADGLIATAFGGGNTEGLNEFTYSLPMTRPFLNEFQDPDTIKEFFTEYVLRTLAYNIVRTMDQDQVDHTLAEIQRSPPQDQRGIWEHFKAVNAGAFTFATSRVDYQRWGALYPHGQEQDLIQTQTIQPNT